MEDINEYIKYFLGGNILEKIGKDGEFLFFCLCDWLINLLINLQMTWWYTPDIEVPVII